MGSASRRILVVDDEREVAETHRSILATLGYQAESESDPRQVEARLAGSNDFSLVLLDLRMPHIDGRQLLRRIQVTRPDVGVIIATVVNDIEEAVRSIKTGAYNYLLKPLHLDRLSEVVASYYDNHPENIQQDHRFSSVVTKSERFKEIFRRVLAFATQDVPVLIQGETGTGKELFASLVHSLSTRAGGRFTAVNVASVSKGLFESELFGHAKGAFTNAITSKEGYCESANGGTLFLDEIGELGHDEQKKLLRLVQERRFCRVGETIERKLDARLVFATNRNLRQEVEQGHFRDDLYYRLAAHQIELPPLRERREDVTHLSEFFLKKYRSQYSKEVASFSPEAMAALVRYPFPGNVRELEGLVSAAVLLEDATSIQLATLPRHIRSPDEDDFVLGHSGLRYREIMAALNECNGNQRRAAERLGIARETLNRLLRKYREREREDAVPQ